MMKYYNLNFPDLLQLTPIEGKDSLERQGGKNMCKCEKQGDAFSRIQQLCDRCGGTDLEPDASN